MNKHLALVLAGTAALSTLGMRVAMADTHPLPNNLGVIAVNEPQNADEDYEIWVDGGRNNPGPTSGYVAVHSDGDVFCSDHGGPYNEDGSPNEDYVQPEEGGDIHCPS